MEGFYISWQWDAFFSMICIGSIDYGNTREQLADRPLVTARSPIAFTRRGMIRSRYRKKFHVDESYLQHFHGGKVPHQ